MLAAMPALSAIRSDQALAPVVFGAAPTRQEAARVASDGTNFFAVWRTRTASDTVVLGGGRISPDGKLLDQPSTLFASGKAYDFGNPDVVFVGDNFLVAYQAGTSLVTRRFARDGRPVGAPFVIEHTAMKTWLATNGKNVFLSTAWNRFRLLAADGTPLGTEHDVPISSYQSYAVGSNGDRYIIAYSYLGPNRTFQGTFFLLNGAGDFQVKKQFPFPPLNSRATLAIASNGSSFLMIAENFCVTVDADGTMGTPRETHVGCDTATWSGDAYTLAWAGAIFPSFQGETGPTGYEINGLRVDAAGVPIGNVVNIATLPSNRPTKAFASASNGRDTILITGDSDDNYDTSDWHTSAAIFKSLEQIEAEPPNRRHAAIASSAREQTASSMASNGTQSLVTWRETTGVDQAIVRAALIAADGQLGAPIDVGVAYSKTTTATASNGRDFLITYVDTREFLVARRVTFDGMLDPAPIVVNDYLAGLPQAAVGAGWSGQVYVVATAAADTIMRVAPDGTVLPIIYGYPEGRVLDSPAFACGSTGCAITWHRPPGLFEYAGETAFASTDTAGNIIVPPKLVTRAPYTTAALAVLAPHGQSVVVYSRDLFMFAARITASGLVLDAPELNGGVSIMKSQTYYQLQPVAAASDGLYFVEPDTATTGRLYWTRIESELAPRVGTLINLHETVPLPLTLTASASNTYFLYSRGQDDGSLLAPRLFLRTIAAPEAQPPGRTHAVR